MIVEATRTRVAAYAEQIESLWAIWDQLLAQVKPDGWSRKYGPDWTFADVPFHLAYFDRIQVADVIEQSDRLPAEERWRARCLRQLNEWNAREFAKRPAGQTTAQSVEQMLAVRERLRRIMAGLADVDLDRPAFNHLMGPAWGTIEHALAHCRQHHWSEVFEFGYRLTGKPAEIRPEITHNGIDFGMRVLSGLVNPDQVAKTKSFTVTFDITGPGGGAWTHRISGGKLAAEQARAEDADLAFRMDSSSCLVMFFQLKNPMFLMLSGKIRVKGFRNMGTFSKLFSRDLDREFVEVNLYEPLEDGRNAE